MSYHDDEPYYDIIEIRAPLLHAVDERYRGERTAIARRRASQAHMFESGVIDGEKRVCDEWRDEMLANQALPR